MSLKFEEVKSLNVGGMKIIPVKTEEDKQVFVKTEKCFSFGVKNDKKFKTISMTLVLDESSAKNLEDIVAQCEEHLGRSFPKTVLYRKEDRVTVYPKFNEQTKLYETGGEIDSMKYEDKRCDVKAVLEVGGILLSGEKASLQMKLYEALVEEHVYERVRLVDMEW